MLHLAAFDALTFDCYGTLVDWEAGILAALRPVLDAHGVTIGDEPLLNLYGELEAAAQDGPFRPYREVLGSVVDGIGERFGFEITPDERGALGGSVPDWPVFPDTPDALRSLKRRFRLCIVSNIDDDLIAKTVANIGVEFDEVVTAQQVRSYKPGRAHFDETLRRLGLPRERVLHVAQSLHHDIAPARALGFSTVWINRQAGRAGATPPSDAHPDLELPDLGSLAARAGG